MWNAEIAELNCSTQYERENVNQAWKKCTLDLIKFIENNGKPSEIIDYNKMLSENNDLKKQYQMVLSALDSIICEKDGDELEISKQNCKKVSENVKEVVTENGEVKRGVEKASQTEEHLSLERSEKINFQVGKNLLSLGVNQKKLVGDGRENQPLKQSQKMNVCSKCFKIYYNVKDNSGSEVKNDESLENEIQTLDVECDKLKKTVLETHAVNKRLENEIYSSKKENRALHEQVDSLQISLKTLTEAINLQDDQLSEYAAIVTSLKQSRSQAISRMKDANERNSYNLMILARLEEQVMQLRSQLDVYHEFLTTHNIEHMDKASSTEFLPVLNQPNEETIKNKDIYIAMLQSRLCEAIIDIKKKDAEINNHTSSMKSVISNLENEKKCLEEHLNIANMSTEKLEEYKIRQQETMKQLMKLIEFLQTKLEQTSKR